MEIFICKLTPIPYPKDGNVLWLHLNIVFLGLLFIEMNKEEKIEEYGSSPPSPIYGKYQLAFFKPFPWGIEDFECKFLGLNYRVFLMNATKASYNNFYAKAPYELRLAPYFHYINVASLIIRKVLLICNLQINHDGI